VLHRRWPRESHSLGGQRSTLFRSVLGVRSVLVRRRLAHFFAELPEVATGFHPVEGVVGFEVLLRKDECAFRPSKSVTPSRRRRAFVSATTSLLQTTGSPYTMTPALHNTIVCQLTGAMPSCMRARGLRSVLRPGTMRGFRTRSRDLSKTGDPLSYEERLEVWLRPCTLYPPTPSSSHRQCIEVALWSSPG